MRIKVSDIPDDGLQQELDVPVVINDNAKADVAHAGITAYRFGKKVLVNGSLSISVSLKCSRCLKEFSLPLNTDFREEYNPADESEREHERELKRRELDSGFYSNGEIDIPEIMREQVLLAVPLKPLCSDKCLGICPHCGKDLNEGPCECKYDEIDPRLEPLKKFNELMEKQGDSLKDRDV